MRASPAIRVLVISTLVLAACGRSGFSNLAGPDALPARSPVSSPAVVAADGISIRTPPAPGTYRFSQSGTELRPDQATGEPVPRPAQGTLDVESMSSVGSGARQQQTSDPGDGTFTTETLLYGPDGVSLISYEIRVPVVNRIRTYVCSPQRPAVILPASIGPGSRWDDTVDCGTPGSFFHYTAHVDGEAVGIALADGRNVKALHVAFTSDILTPDLVAHSEGALEYSPELRLAVHAATTSHGSVSGYPFRQEGEDRLVGLP